MIIGFDASTTTCGYSFFDGNNILDAGFIDISKIEKNSDKAFHVINTLEKSPYISSVKQIKLEAALSGFMRGRTSQQVVIKLARFNAVFEYIIETHWKIPVELISANTARKSVLGKSFSKGMTAKEYVKIELPKLVPNLNNFFKLTSRNNFDKRNEDLMDAIVISMS